MKKIFTIILAFVMAISMVACGGQDKKEAFYIGATGPITGGAAEYGIAVNYGAQVAVNEINAKGGIQIEFKLEDDTHDAEKAVNAYNSLKDWGMQIFMGSVTSTPGEATAAKADQDHIFFLTPSASSPNVVDGKDTCFQVCFDDPTMGLKAAEYISENIKDAKKIAIIYKNDDSYSTGIYEKFVDKANSLGLEIVYKGTFDDSTDSNFESQVSAAKKAKADLVFLPIYYTPASAIFKEAAKQEFSPLWFGVDGMDGILAIEGFDTKLAEGVYLLSPFSANSTDAKTVAFVDAYKKLSGGAAPNQFAADAYDCIYAIYDALVAAGCKYSDSTSSITDALVSKFTSMSYDGLTGVGMTWEKGGAVSKDPFAFIIKDGKYELLK